MRLFMWKVLSNNASKMTNTAVWGNECAGNPVHLATYGYQKFGL